MIIWLPKKIRPTGGTSSFARSFKAAMEKRGHTVHFSMPSHYDVLLACPRAPWWALLHAWLNKHPIVQRLDGVYHPGSQVGRWWRLHNLPLSVIRTIFAERLIYQSSFSRAQCNRYLWPVSNSKERAATRIYNGAETKTFTPHGPANLLRTDPNEHVIITWSRFRRPDQIDPLVAGFRAYQALHHKQSRLIVIGDFTGAVAKRPAQFRDDTIEFHGALPHTEVPRYARGADAFILTHRNPPCPNNVIEAMACGLPVVGVANGAMPELIDERRGVLTSGSPEELADGIARVLTKHHTVQPRHDLTLSHAIAQYEATLTAVL